MFFILVGGNHFFAQEMTLDEMQRADSSKITLWESVMNGCVISPVNFLEFKFYPDSTVIKFCPSLENSMQGGEDEFKFAVVPYNLRNKIHKYEESLEREGRRIDYRNNPHYRIEFDRFIGYAEYRLNLEEHLVLSKWFEELSKESQSTH